MKENLTAWILGEEGQGWAWRWLAASIGSYWILTSAFLGLNWLRCRAQLKRGVADVDQQRAEALYSFGRAGRRLAIAYVVLLICSSYLFFDQYNDMAWRLVVLGNDPRPGGLNLAEALFAVGTSFLTLGRLALAFTLFSIPTYSVDKLLRGTSWSLGDYLKEVTRSLILVLVVWFFMLVGIKWGGSFSVNGVYIGLFCGLVAGYVASHALVWRLWPLSPLGDAELSRKLEMMFKTAGIKTPKLLVMENSSAKVANAMVTGVTNGSRRVIFTRAFLDKASQPAVLAVAGHEIGHLIHGHILKRLAFQMVFVGGGISAMVYFSTKWAWSPILLLSVCMIWGFLIIPMAYGRYSRGQEFQADSEAVKLMGGDARAVAEAFESLASNNFQVRRWRGLFRFTASHPSWEERMARVLKGLEP